MPKSILPPAKLDSVHSSRIANRQNINTNFSLLYLGSNNIGPNLWAENEAHNFLRSLMGFLDYLLQSKRKAIYP